MPNLTSNDSAVLQALFDAESSPSSGITIDSTLPPFPDKLQVSKTEHEKLSTRERSIITDLQVEDVSRETIQSAIEALTALIEEYPTYPSAYVNRAQAFRMLVDNLFTEEQTFEMKVDGPLFNDPGNKAIVSRLLSDLGRAITLCTPSSPTDPISPIQARILADTHTHRGYVLLKAARAKANHTDKSSLKTEEESPQIWELDADQLEEVASRDFLFGGRYGHKIAQQLSVQTNPYAKMCGAIVKEAMRKEAEGAPVST